MTDRKLHPFACLLAVVALIGDSETRACGNYLGPVTRLILSGNAAERNGACQLLRASGQAGLDALFETYEKEIKAFLGGAESNKQWRMISDALDRVSRQRDAYASQLYWHTDLEKAKQRAAIHGKPILSLRLLGNLDDEFSCANSRFFRTVLYANADIAKLLRENFILHWHSVRPVPRVTIDFGDGRKLERTVTGNSMHLVLDAKGRLIDALPGLYGPDAFIRAIKAAQWEAKLCADLNEQKLARRQAFYHALRSEGLRTNWAMDMEAIGRPTKWSPRPRVTRIEPGQEGRQVQRPSARQASRLAVGKRLSEATILAHVVGLNPEVLEKATDTEAWRKLALHRATESRLDPSSIALMRRQYGKVCGGEKDATVKTAFATLVRDFESAIAEDTVRNEYTLHFTIHEWLKVAKQPVDIAGFTDRVYAELFLTPGSDPWLGFAPGSVYTALGDDGVSKSPAVR